MIRLDRWSIVPLPTGPRTPPECRPAALSGVRPDGQAIRTSRIQSVSGREVCTESGSRYVLGEVDPGYSDYLASIGRPRDALPTMEAK